MSVFDPYAVLGVTPQSSDDEIKKAYRNLSRRFHPDANINNPNKAQAEEQFKLVQQAYEQVMRDRQRGYTQEGYQNGPYQNDPYGQAPPPGWDQDLRRREWYMRQSQNYTRPYSSTGGFCMSLLMLDMCCGCCC